MQSKSPYQRRRLVGFHSNTVFWTIYNCLLCSLHTHKIWKRSVEKYESCGTLSTTTHFVSAFCEAGVVQQCPEAQAGMVQDGINHVVVEEKTLFFFFLITHLHCSPTGCSERTPKTSCPVPSASLLLARSSSGGPPVSSAWRSPVSHISRGQRWFRFCYCCSWQEFEILFFRES